MAVRNFSISSDEAREVAMAKKASKKKVSKKVSKKAGKRTAGDYHREAGLNSGAKEERKRKLNNRDG